MDNKRINWQKSAASFTTIFLILILAFSIVVGVFNFMTVGVEQYNANLLPHENQTFQDLMDSQDNLSSSIDGIRESVADIKVQTGFLQTFWNSFVGLGRVLLLPLDLIDIGISSTQTMLLGTVVIPSWATTLILMAITIIIILTIVAALTGGNSNI